MEDSTPIIIGAGQFSEKNVHPLEAHSPVDLAAEAARRAMFDTSVENTLPQLIDTVAMIRLFSDSPNRPRLLHNFGRAENPPRAVARRIGAIPATAIYSELGGNSPQALVNEMAQRIVAGDVSIALLAGAEALKTTRDAVRKEIKLDWAEADSGTLDDRGMGEALTTPHEFEHGIGIPVQTYPLFENSIRGQLGTTVNQHLLTMGKLFQPFTEIAAANPFAFFGTYRPAEELAFVTEDNRFIGFPYPKFMNGRDAVNQSAALIMTSVGKAKELQIDPARWIFLHGCGEANDKLMHQRKNYYSSPGINASVASALAMAGKTAEEMSYFDIYSCFPSAVEIACAEIGLEIDDPRQLTLTGGLPFFGGPGNNYSMHGIATLVPKLRANPGKLGMITANGGWLSKHAVGIYSTTPTQGMWQRESAAIAQQAINDLPNPSFTEKPAGDAVIETYTVSFDRHGPVKGIVIGRLSEGDIRFVANTPEDPEQLAAMVNTEMLGRSGTVSRGPQGRNIFVPRV